MGSALATETSRQPEGAITARSLPGTRARTLVLTYHAVFATYEEWAKQEPSRKWYALTASQFEAQMEYLSHHGFTTFLLSEFLAGTLPQKSVVLTFDDGHESNYSIVLPILQKFRFRAEFFVIVSRIGRSGYLSWDQLNELAKAGMSVQSHGMHHEPLSQLPDETLKKELRDARKCLEQNLGTSTKYLALPGGFADRRVYGEALAAGYEAVCNSEPSLASTGSIIPRVTIMHSTSHPAFCGLVQRKFFRLLRIRAQREFGKAAKVLLGGRRYEALKHFQPRVP